MGQATLLGSTAVTRGVAQFDAALEAFESVSAEDVLRAAQAYLTPERRTVGWLQPQESSAASPGLSHGEQHPGSDGARQSAAKSERKEGSTPPFQQRRHTSSVLGSRQLSAPPQIIQPQQVMRAPLPGGAVLLVYPTATYPSVFVRVQLEAGALFDPAGKEGTAQLTAALAAQATRSLTAEELAVRTDALGISIEVNAGRETAVGTLKCLPEDLETGLGYLTEVLTHPSFPPDEFQRLRERTLTAIRQARNDTRSTAARCLSEMIYPKGHPYHLPAHGSEESVAGLTREDVVAFHQQCYRPAGAVVSVVGNVNPDRVHRTLLSLWAGWSGGVGRRSIPGVPAPAGGRRHCTVEGKSLTDVAMGWPLVDRNHPDHLALLFPATLFGGNGTPASSRLFRNVRERCGVSYYQFASYSTTSGPAAWSVHIGVNPSRLEFALDRVQEELKRLSTEPVPADELHMLKSFLTDYPSVQHESAERLAARLGEIERNGLGLDYLERLTEQMQALTAEELQAVARRHLRLDCISIATAGPGSTTSAE